MRKQKFLALLLALVMLLSLVPFAAFAEGETSSDDGNALHLSKTAELQADGTYKIVLEAYATGTVTTSTESVPCDIVLLLDQSGSMNDALGTMQSSSFSKVTISTWTAIYISQFINTLWRENPVGPGQYEQVYLERTDDQYTLYDSNGNVIETQATGVGALFGSPSTTIYTYTTSTTETSKQKGLQTAAVNFVNATAEKNAVLSADQQHRIAIVKFADDSYATSEPGDDKNTDGYNYTQIVENMTAVNSTTVDGLVNSINNLEAAGATAADYGMNKAIAALGDLSTDDGRKKIIIMFTDGEPNHSNGFSTTVANSTVSAAKTVKDKGVIVYTIGVLADADPTQDPTSSSSDNFNKYLHAVSSNYPEATSITALGSKGSYTDGYYKTATTADELNSIFKEIQNSIGSTTVTLDGGAVMKDIISDNFVLPGGVNYDLNNITIQTASYTGNGEFGDAVDATNVRASIGADGKTVNVTGFSYKDNYCVDASGTVATSGKKLIVTITGVEVDPNNFADGAVYTNNAASGIYEDDQQEVAVENFAMPQVTLASKSYVLDYAKSVVLDSTEWGVGTLIHRAGNTHGFTTADTTGKITMTYGDLSGSTYTPKTTNWNGYDSFYAFGELETDSYIWSKVNVIPANNVYYEDDFVSTTESTIKNEDGTTTTDKNSVQIVYNGNNTVSTVSTESAESSETGNGAGVQGWETALADDTAFSDGSATKLTTGAKASFTFTGTGVDIYSYTDMTTGVVTAGLYGVNGETVTRKYLMVDNLAVSGEYYQIPTLSFQGLDYGTYTVTLVVGTGNAVAKNEDGSVKTEVVINEDGTTTKKIVYTDGVRSTYYLDGIRVYNPIQNLESTDTVKNAYGEKELNAVFAEVRDLMGENTSEDGDTGTVFIDLDGSGNVADKTAYDATEYGTYGPKNEVYLAEGQSITFKVDGNSSNYYYVGLKAPEGNGATALISNGTENAKATIGHTTDLYYKVVPTSAGMITIQNKDDENAETANLLSITKIKMTGADTTSGIMLLDLTEEEAVAEVAAFSLRSTVAYTAAAEEEVPEETTPEETVPEETTPEETVPEETEPEVPDIDIEIENPTEPEPEQKPENKPAANEALKDLVKNLFNKIFGWFGR